MANGEDRQWDSQGVRAIIDEWVTIKQEAFASAFVKALKAQGEELALSTITSALSNAKKNGHEPALKQLFGSAARRTAFATAAGRTIEELEGRLWVTPSERPLVFAVALDHANGNVGVLSRILRAIDERGADPRLVVDARWRSTLRSLDQDALDSWRSKGWVVQLDGAGEAFEASLSNAYAGSSRRRAWLLGTSRRKLPIGEAVRIVIRGEEPVFDPGNFHERLVRQGSIAEAPRPHPVSTENGVGLRNTSLSALAREAGADPAAEPFSPIAVAVDEVIGDRHAALVEIARGHAPREVLQRRGLKPEQLPGSIRPLADGGHHVEWGVNARLALSLGGVLGEETAIAGVAIDRVIEHARRAEDRARFMKEHAGTQPLPEIGEPLVRKCRDLHLAFSLISPGHAGIHYAYTRSVFVEEARNGTIERSIIPLVGEHSVAPATGDPFARTAGDQKARGNQPAQRNNPLHELAAAATVGVEAAWLALISGFNGQQGRAPDLTELPDHWDRTERAVAALHTPGERVTDPRQRLVQCLERPIAFTGALWPSTKMIVPFVTADRTSLTSSLWLERQGAAVLPWRSIQGAAKHEMDVIRALLWLKAVLRQGESVELLEAQRTTRLVLSDLRGFVAEATVWRGPHTGPDSVAAIVPVTPFDRSVLGQAFRTHQVRYADEVTFPSSLWLGWGEVIARVDFGPPSGLLDWEPVNAAEQDLIAADEARAAEEDDD